MIKLTYLAPILLASIAACSSGGKSPVHVTPDAAGSGSAAPDAPGLCGLAATTPAIVASPANVRWVPENLVKDASGLQFPMGSATEPGEMYAVARLPASPENSNMMKPDAIQILMFEQTQGQGMPIVGAMGKTFTIGSTMDTPPGDIEANPFDPMPKQKFQIQINAFDGSNTVMGSNWLAVQGTITIAKDSTTKFTGSFDNVVLVHYLPNGTGGASPAPDAQDCATMSGKFSWDAAPVKGTFTGRDDVDPTVQANIDYINSHHGGYEKPAFLK